jgi:hypothetical protein
MGEASRKPIISWLQNLNESSHAAEAPSFDDKLAKLETSSGGRIGLFAINTGNT